jgi:hypothetical protein
MDGIYRIIGSRCIDMGRDQSVCVVSRIRLALYRGVSNRAILALSAKSRHCAPRSL